VNLVFLSKLSTHIHHSLNHDFETNVILN